MNILRTEFENYADRILYGRTVRYSEKNSIAHGAVSQQTQEQFHDLMLQMIAEIQNSPASLNVPDIPDNPCKPGYTATHHPEHFKQRNAVTQPIDFPFDLLYAIGKYGAWSGNSILEADFSYVRKHFKHLLIKDLVNSLESAIAFLSAFGFNIEISLGVKQPERLIVSHSVNAYLLNALKLLTETNDRNAFNACLFSGDCSFYVERLNTLLGLDSGYILSVLERYKERGYEIKYDILGCSADKNGSGCKFGFREYEQPSFSFTSSALGIKAMLADYDSLDGLTRQLLVESCNKCSDCLFCAKGKGGIVTKKQHAQNIEHKDKSYRLCPYYPNLAWRNHEITKEVIEKVFSFNITQEKYAKDWRKQKN